MGHQKDNNQPAEASMDQVRELLFGSQMRQVADRLQRKDDEVRSRLEEITSDHRAAVEKLERALYDADAATSEKITQLYADLENRAKHLSESISKTESNLSVSMADIADKLLAAIADRHQEATNLTRQVESDLRRDLASKESLANALRELADKISRG
ncbi:MAG: hypothetical protein LBU73_01500 [Helicobacteraceae bacterium]|jgi:signal transduction histidine kinase|nr:hypothetical protein [Helicobacteraceae bacterium]